MDETLNRMLSLIPRKPDGKYVHGAKKEFCQRIGAPTNIISEWETGKTKSYRNYLYTVASVYDVSVEWLKGESDEKSPPPKDGELNPDYMKLNAANRAAIDAAIAALLKSQQSDD